MGNSESTQTQTRSSNAVARGGSNGQIVSNNANAVATRGNAKAYIIQGVGALAMARGPEGQAAAYTDGYTTGILTSGNGQAGIEGGLAWAKVGIDNVAAAFSGAAHYTSQRALEGCCPCSGRAAIDECRCRCHR